MKPHLEIAINDRVLNAILSRGWKDYDNFSFMLSRKIVEQTPDSLEALTRMSKSIKSSFFTLNHVTPEVFSKALPFEEMIALYPVNRESEPLTFMDVFSEINNVNLDEAKKDTIKLATLPESVSQEALVDSYEKRMPPIVEAEPKIQYWKSRIWSILPSKSKICQGLLLLLLKATRA